jgi:endonuclease-3
VPPAFAPLYAHLKKLYPRPQCALDHKNPFELLAATILSAQCTDKRVNLVTPNLFALYPTPAHLAAASLDEVEEAVRTTGFFRNKAKSLVGMAQALERDHAGKVPRTMEDLLKLPGVARKTANVVLGVGYKLAVGVVVDTHVMRLSGRLGLSRAGNPQGIERDLMKYVPQAEWIPFSHRLILHGRVICKARRPSCADCRLLGICPRMGVDAVAQRAGNRKKILK